MYPIKSSYGSWKSPITADLIVAGTKTYKELFVENGNVYWVESRPEEGGRYAIVKFAPSEKQEEFLPKGYYARTTVYEYGGASVLVKDDILYFSNFDPNKPGFDQQLYKMEQGKNPVPITFQGNMRYAEGVFCPSMNKLIYIREDHNTLNRAYAVTEIVAVDPDGRDIPKVLISYPKDNSKLSHERDFYSSVFINRDGDKIAWLSWNFKNMPWDSNEFWVADISEEGSLKNIERIAGNCSDNLNPSNSQASDGNGKPQSLVQPLSFTTSPQAWNRIYPSPPAPMLR